MADTTWPDSALEAEMLADATYRADQDFPIAPATCCHVRDLIKRVRKLELQLERRTELAYELWRNLDYECGHEIRQGRRPELKLLWELGRQEFGEEYSTDG